MDKGGDDGLRYYVYISETKLDMLIEQIPEIERSKLAAELKIDVKVLTLTVHKDIELAANRSSRLRAVLKHLAHRNWVGPIEEGGEYCVATLPMTWGTMEARGGGANS